MPPLTSGEKRKFKAAAQRLDPVLTIGRNGVTEALLQSLDEVLTQHQLVKIRFAEFKDRRKELAREIAEKSGSELITVVGHVAVLYRALASGE